MKLLIAEKPDQANALVSQFKTKKMNGYIVIEPNKWFPKGGYCTWAIGHLLQLQTPEYYDPKWKRWNITDLPIIPAKFQYEIIKSKNKQFSIIKHLLSKKEISEIIHGGDAGREGELIIRSIILKAGVRKPIKRLWISSLTPKAILEGFEHLRSEESTRNLYFEAYTRSCADWLIGMNASRIYTLLLKQKGIHDVFSVGRVQTPTLAIIVKREYEIERFESKPFWEVVAKFSTNGNEYEGKWELEKNSRIDRKQLAEKIAEFCRGKKAEISVVEKERKEYAPPLLFNLSGLQAIANRIYKLSPQKTLDTLQLLYQKGIISYPRTDSSYVTKGEAETFPETLKKLSQFKDFANYFPLPIQSLKNNKRYVNEKKVTDHYAIIPTDQVVDPSRLSADEYKLYCLIVKRLIAAHYPPAIYDYSKVITVVDQRAQFVSKGKQQKALGWKAVLLDQDDSDTLLPIVHKGDPIIVEHVEVKEGATKPPKRFTEGQLIMVMKTAGKYVDDEQLEKVLHHTEGLGTEATRAGIITMLKDRGYIEVSKNQVYATNKGKILIQAVGESILASPILTAKWEQRLAEIGEGKASPAHFMEQTKKLSQKLISDATSGAGNWNFSGLNYNSKAKVKNWNKGRKYKRKSNKKA